MLTSHIDVQGDYDDISRCGVEDANLVVKDIARITKVTSLNLTKCLFRISTYKKIIVIYV